MEKYLNGSMTLTGVACPSPGTLTREKADLEEQLHSLQSEQINWLKEKERLNQEILRLKRSESESEAALTSMRGELQGTKSELEERQCEVTSYARKLDLLREEQQELRMEMDLLAAAPVNRDMNAKGNSLFSEVEDRRKVVERQLETLKVRHCKNNFLFVQWTPLNKPTSGQLNLGLISGWAY